MRCDVTDPATPCAPVFPLGADNAIKRRSGAVAPRVKVGVGSITGMVKWTAGAFGAAALALAAATPAQAQGTPPREDVILVLDASGSMWGQIDGEAKITIARNVVGELLEDLPETRRLGLVAYGHTRKGDCNDIETLAEVGASRAEIRRAVEAINPKGMTPISASVRFAAEQLRYTEMPATVILVSDGEETCNLDPCEVGTALEASGVNFTAHVIGFDIENEAHRAQLQCLAENTGGIYVNASNSAELADALEQTVAEAPEMVRETILSLRATDLKGGPEIETGLDWRVTLAGTDDEVHAVSGTGNSEVELAAGTYDVSVAWPEMGLEGETLGVVLREGAPRTVTIALEQALEATLAIEPEGTAPVSSEITVTWTGPARRGDFITITAPDAAPSSYSDYEYPARSGNRLTLRMPVDPGAYEVRYVVGSAPNLVIARMPIEAVPTEATLSAPDTVNAGAVVAVEWAGPGYNDDWITIVKPEAGERSYGDYAHTRNGNPLELTAPLEAGAYEVRYVQAGEKVIVRRPIMVEAVGARVTGPASATVGTVHDIDWLGPNGQRDWITVVAPDAGARSYGDYAKTRDGSPISLKMPLEPGTYEIRYVQGGEQVIARQPIEIVEAEVTLTAPDEATVGQKVEIAFQGPGVKGDWLTVVAPDAGARRYGDYARAIDGSPARIDVPLEPGTYEVRYVLDGRRVVATKPITIRESEASIAGPARVVAGERFEVDWTGPGNNRDMLTVVGPDQPAQRYEDYRYTRQGSPAALTAPSTPGRYELRYVLGGRRVIATTPIEVVGRE